MQQQSFSNIALQLGPCKDITNFWACVEWYSHTFIKMDFLFIKIFFYPVLTHLRTLFGDFSSLGTQNLFRVGRHSNKEKHLIYFGLYFYIQKNVFLILAKK
jgi:hypothetical protein